MINEKFSRIKSSKIQPDGSLELEISIDKTMLTNVFDQDNFRDAIIKLVARKVVDSFPIESINAIRNKVDIDAVAKMVTLEIVKDMSKSRD